MRELDRRKPYAVVFGTGEKYVFEQGGRKFNGQGFEVIVKPKDSPSYTPDSLMSLSAISEMAAMAAESPPGAFIEIGVYKGGSAKALYDLSVTQARPLFLFDTFEGMPYWVPDLDIHKKGDFGDVDFGEICKMFPQAQIFKGVFPDTMPDYLSGIAFAHVDCDQYEATKAACEILHPLMVEGGVILFDDYGLEGAKKAINEAFGDELLFTEKHSKAFVCTNRDLFPWEKFVKTDQAKDPDPPQIETPTEEEPPEVEKPIEAKTRLEAMNALEDLGVPYNKRERRSVLIAKLNDALEAKTQEQV